MDMEEMCAISFVEPCDLNQFDRAHRISRRKKRHEHGRNV